MPSETVPPARRGALHAASRRPNPMPSLATSRANGLDQHALSSIVRFDAEGALVGDLPTLAASTGLSEDDLANHGWLRAVAKEDRAAVRANWERAVRECLPFAMAMRWQSWRDPPPIDEVDQPFDVAAGERWMLLRAVPLIADGRVSGWEGTLSPLEGARPAASAASGITAGPSGSESAQEDDMPLALPNESPEHLAAFLSETLDAMTDGVIICDHEGNIRRINAAMRAFYERAGIPSPEDTAMSVRRHTLDLRRLDGSALPAAEWPLMRLLRGEVLTGSNALEVRFVLPDGSSVIESATGAPLRDADGAIIGAVCVMRDTTESQQLAQALRERASELETIFEAITDAVLIYRLDGSVAEMNSAARALFAFGREPEHASQVPSEHPTRYHEVTDEHGAPLAVDRWPMMRILGGEMLMGDQAIDVTVINGAGRHVPVSFAGAPVHDAAGIITGGVGVYRDVTRRRQVEARSRAALDILITVAQLLGDAQAWKDITHLLTNVTEMLSRLDAVDYAHTMLMDEEARTTPIALAGVTPEVEAIWREEVRRGDPTRLPGGDAVYRRLCAGDVFVQHFNRDRPFVSPLGIKAMRVRSAITAPVLVDGHLRALITLGRARGPEPGSASGFAPWDEDLLVGVSRLIGEALKHATLAEQLHTAETARAVAEETTRQRDEFIGIAGHELRTPLTTVWANAQLLDRGLVQLRDLLTTEHALAPEAATRLARLDEYASRILRRSVVLARLINDLVDVSRLHADRLDLAIRPVDLAEVLREVVTEEQQAHPDRTITVHGLGPSVHLPAQVDPDRVGQVLTTYLSNALKYAPPDLPITVAVSRLGANIRVTVRDFGPGLDAEQHPHIWERFYRAPGIKVLSGSGFGLGLGLYIARGIVERHGGQVGIESAPGEGTTFWFILPRIAHEGDTEQLGPAQ